MSFRIGNVAVIVPEPENAKCEECGKMEELRPYGKGGACICFDCAQKIPEIVEHNMNVQLFGKPGELK